MPTEEQIKQLAYSIWEQEGRPEGKDVEHYFRAKQILEEREAAQARPPMLQPQTLTRALKTPPLVPQLEPKRSPRSKKR